MSHITQKLAAAIVCLSLAACGGGSGGDSPAPAGGTGTTQDTSAAQTQASSTPITPASSGTQLPSPVIEPATTDILPPVMPAPLPPATQSTAPLAPPASDSTVASVRFDRPTGIAVDAQGNIYVADNSRTVRRITPTGAVSIIAGTSGAPGSADGVGTAAQFTAIADMSVDGMGNIYVSDGGAIRRITPDGVVTTIAGRVEEAGSADGPAAVARFNEPRGIAIGANGVLFVADSRNHTIRRISTAGEVSTVAGAAGQEGNVNGGALTQARFKHPTDVVADAAGALYVADHGSATIRRIANGVVSLVAGSQPVASSDGVGSSASFLHPLGIVIGQGGNLYVLERFAFEKQTYYYYNGLIRRVTPDGVATTLVGTPGKRGSEDGTGSAATFFYPGGIAVDAGNNMYVADTFNHTIRRVTPDGVVTTVAGVAGQAGS